LTTKKFREASLAGIGRADANGRLDEFCPKLKKWPI